MTRAQRIKEILWILAAFFVVTTVLRLIFGLGAATNLTDAMPWGLWKIFNMVAGVALATGGFTTAAIVYVLHMDKYKSLLRPAVIVAFLGYGVSATSLMFDIGLPHRIWHPLVPGMWNHHSFLFEVCWCVFLYFMVTIIELSPILAEKSPWRKLAHFLHKISIPVVIVGITLSTLHHSSLGSLFLVTPGRLHPLWYTGTWLPFHFFFSAVGAGMMTVVLVVLAYGYIYGKDIDFPAVNGMAKISAWVLGLFLVLRLAEITAHGKWPVVFSGQWESYVFGVEIFLQAVIPVALILIPRVRNSKSGLATAAAFAMLGLVMHRMDTGITGYVSWLGTPYWPSIPEIAFTLGIYAAGGLVFMFLAEYFDVFEKVSWKRPEEELEGDLAPLWDYATHSAPVRVSLLLVIAVPVAVLLYSNSALKGFPLVKRSVEAPVAVDSQRHVLLIDGDRNGNGVIFPHEKHKKLAEEITGKTPACNTCHHLSKPMDKNTACYHCHTDMMLEKSIFNHRLHEKKLGGNKSCAACHDLGKPESRANAKECASCHGENMGMEPREAGKMFNEKAVGYENAMHAGCVKCHEEQASRYDKPRLYECATCHEHKLPTSTSRESSTSSVPVEGR